MSHEQQNAYHILRLWYMKIKRETFGDIINGNANSSRTHHNFKWSTYITDVQIPSTKFQSR